jgi:hypothetical protein
MPFRSLRSSEMIKGPATMKMSAHLSWAATGRAYRPILTT